MLKLSGTIYRYGSEERIKYATVKAWSKGKKPALTFADDDGDFKFDNLDPGKWTLLALDENSMPGARVEVELIEDTSDIKLELQRLAETLDLKMGRNFFIGLLVSLVVLIAVYILLHVFLKTGIDPQADTFIWTEGAWRFLELFMWSLAGILVNKIINSGWYLRSGRFYREGMMMHIAHLATTPLLVLVAVVILSLASLTLTLANNNEITLDLSDPNIMIAIAFLLGTSPWPLWRFIEDTAKRVTGQ